MAKKVVKIGKKIIPILEGLDPEDYRIMEGKKTYYQTDNVGSAKYTISYHDGKKKNKDGSDFFGIKIFKNKKERDSFINDLLKDGYVYKRSLSEAEEEEEKVEESFFKLKPTSAWSNSEKKELLNYKNKTSSMLDVAEKVIYIASNGSVTAQKVLTFFNKGKIRNLIKDFSLNTGVFEFADNVISLFSSMKEKVAEKSLKEADNKYAYTIVYVTGMGSITAELNDRNYKNVKKFEDEISKQFMDKYQTDDFWVDDVIASRNSPDVDADIFTDRGTRLDQNNVKMIFSDTDFGIKAKFLVDQGYDITEDNLDEVIVWGATSNIDYSDDKDYYYPTEFVDEEMENFYPNLVKELEKANAESYFNAANVIRDWEYNGDLRTSWYRDIFVYSFLR